MLLFYSSYHILILILFYSVEAGSPATKKGIVTNKILFMSNGLSPGYSRKIDLLLKCKEMKVAVELASNEWKRSAVRDTVKLQQQRNNVRVNSAILNNLGKFDIQETMVMDWVGTLQGNIINRIWLDILNYGKYIVLTLLLFIFPGNSEYLYSLEWVSKDHFVRPCFVFSNGL